MRHPFESIPNLRRGRVFKTLLALTMVIAIALGRIDVPLHTESAPNGIVGFELAGDAATAARMIASWDAKARMYAALSLGLDYLFLCVYSTALAFACVWAAGVLRRGSPSLGNLALGVAWLQWVAAFCDGVENFALWLVLTGDPSDIAPAIARAFSLVKFALIAIGFVVAIAGVAMRASSRSTAD